MTDLEARPTYTGKQEDDVASHVGCIVPLLVHSIIEQQVKILEMSNVLETFLDWWVGNEVGEGIKASGTPVLTSNLGYL